MFLAFIRLQLLLCLKSYVLSHCIETEIKVTGVQSLYQHSVFNTIFFISCWSCFSYMLPKINNQYITLSLVSRDILLVITTREAPCIFCHKIRQIFHEWNINIVGRLIIGILSTILISLLLKFSHDENYKRVIRKRIVAKCYEYQKKRIKILFLKIF